MKSLTTGIFIHRISFSETSLIALFYTREFGLRRFLFKGGKKKSHNLFPMAVCEVSYYGRKESELLNVTAVEPALPLSYQFDPIKSTVAFFMAEVLKKCTYMDEPDDATFLFMTSKSQELNQLEDCSMFPIRFLIDLSEHLGIQPYIEGTDASFFNLDEGLVEGRNQSQQRVAKGRVVSDLKDLIQGNEPPQMSKLMREDALTMMLEYYRIHIPNFGTVSSHEIVREVLSA
ncbi:MAG: recombination protein O N-terminal domain-containing protein [Crocinitomicaceae bacterium]|nr:recombination protein O N-terminal domain-containing protein [Crocinitomicaceae bacterium]